MITTKILTFINHIKTFLGYVIAPPFCAFCKEFISERTPLCAECTHRITPVVTTELMITKNYFVKVFAISKYQDPLAQLIKAKHYGDRVSSHQLGELIWQLTNIKNIPCDYLVPIPLHWTRYAWRGFNQAHEIARVLSGYTQKPVTSLLRRNKRTVFQATLSKIARASNVHGAFLLSCHDVAKYQGKHLVLVDDLLTTGATVTEAVKVLRTLKPASITVVVACRV